MNQREADLVQQFLGQLLIVEQKRPIQDVIVSANPKAAGRRIVIIMEKSAQPGFAKRVNLITVGDMGRYLDRLFPSKSLAPENVGTVGRAD